MKKGKVFGKGQLTVIVMVLTLGAAIWLNTKYLPSDTKYLGEASYVNGTSSQEAVETSAKVEEDYFTNAKKEREEAVDKAIETIEETLKSENLTQEDKTSALKEIEEIGASIKKENNIETLLKAKGFERTLAVISDSGINIIVGSEGLTTAQTLQIQEIATSQSGIELSKIKIIPIK